MAPRRSGGAIFAIWSATNSAHTNANDPEGVVRIQLNLLMASHDVFLARQNGGDQAWVETQARPLGRVRRTSTILKLDGKNAFESKSASSRFIHTGEHHRTLLMARLAITVTISPIRLRNAVNVHRARVLRAKLVSLTCRL